MVVLKRLIEGSQLGTAAATYYTSPTNVKTLIKKLTLTNTSAGAVKVTIHLVPPAATAADANTLWKQRTLAAGETKEVFEAQNHVLEPGASLQALADAAAAVTIQASGAELT